MQDTSTVEKSAIDTSASMELWEENENRENYEIGLDSKVFKQIHDSSKDMKSRIFISFYGWLKEELGIS